MTVQLTLWELALKDSSSYTTILSKNYYEKQKKKSSRFKEKCSKAAMPIKISFSEDWDFLKELILEI